MNEKRKAYMAEYTQRPEVRSRRLAYDRAYRRKYRGDKPRVKPSQTADDLGDAYGNGDMIAFQYDAREADQKMQERLFKYHPERFVERF